MSTEVGHHVHGWLPRSVIRSRLVAHESAGCIQRCAGWSSIRLSLGMVSALRVVCCRLWTISVEVLGWMS